MLQILVTLLIKTSRWEGLNIYEKRIHVTAEKASLRVDFARVKSYLRKKYSDPYFRPIGPVVSEEFALGQTDRHTDRGA